MADSTGNDTLRQAPSETDSQDRTKTAKDGDGPIVESTSTPEAPSLWHAGAQSECWTSTSATESVSCGSPFAARGRPALRLRRLPRRRTSLHCSRPLEGAAARFISPRSEFLTD
jgi:hypothetical protein